MASIAAASSLSRYGDVPCFTNGLWTIYGRDYSYLYAQPSAITYPTFTKIAFIPHPSNGPLAAWLGFPGGLVSNTEAADSDMYEELLAYFAQITPDEALLQQFGDLPWISSSLEMRPTGLRSYSLEILPRREFECALVSYTTLKNFWNLECKMPSIVPLKELKIEAYIHDYVAIVSLPFAAGHYTLKTNPKPHLLYHEMETLLRMAPHPNVLSRPLLVTKATLDSNIYPWDSASRYLSAPNRPIVGFLTEYHEGGTLGAALAADKEVSLRDQARWCRQLASALAHIQGTRQKDGRCGFYTDLKLDNIVLSRSRDLILIDFEKAGSWALYTPPEILSSRPRRASRGSSDPRFRLSFSEGPTPGRICGICSPHPCAVPRGSSTAAFDIHMSIFEYKQSPINILARENSDRPCLDLRPIHFWDQASDLEREKAMVYMLGCVLWCILERKPCISEWTERRVAIRSEEIPGSVKSAVQVAFDLPERRLGLSEMLAVFEEWEQSLSNCESGLNRDAFSEA